MLKNIFKTKKFQFFAVFCVCFVACFGISLVARATTEEILTMIIGYPLNIVAALLGQAVKIAGSILDWVLSPTAFGLIKDNAVIDIGWTIVRDLVNMFFILILLVVAFAKVLDISKFKNDIVIIRLVVAALMINFSKVICMFMIDAANILTMFFVKGMPNGTIGENLANALKIQNLFQSNLTAATGTEIGKISILVTLAFVDIILALTAAVFFYLAIILVIRMIYLWVLTMFSPGAWFGWILSGNFNFGGWWSKFWDNLAKAPIAAFGIYITIQIATIPGGLASKINASMPQSTTIWNAFGNSLNMILQYAIIVILLYMCYAGTKKGAAGAGAFATKQITKGSGYAFDKMKKAGMGAVGYGAAKLAGTQKGKGTIEKLQTWRKEAEKIPGIGRAIGGPGAYRQAQEKKYEAAKKLLGGNTADELVDIINQTPVGEEGLQRRAAAISQLASKDPDKLTSEHQEMIKKLQGIEIGATLDKEILATKPDWYHVFGKSLPQVLAKIKTSKLENVSAKILDPANPHAGVMKAAITNALNTGDWTSGHLRNVAKSDNVELTAHMRTLLHDIVTVPARKALLPIELQNYLNSPEGKAIFP